MYLSYAPETLAIAFIVLVGITAIIFMIVMLFRILSETQGGYQIVMDRSQEISKAGENLGEVMGVLEEILMRLNTLKAYHDEAQVASTTPVISPEALKSLERLLKAMPLMAVKELESILAEMHRLLSSLNHIQPEAYAQWISEHQEAMIKVLGKEKVSSGSLGEMEEIFLETQPLIEQWVEEGQRAGQAPSESPETRAMLEQQEHLLKEARRRVRETEDKLKLLTQQVETLLSHQAKHKTEEKLELERLRQQNTQLTQDRASLMRHLENMSGEIKRTRLEKKFIEDRFVDMDQKAREEDGSEALEAGAP